MHRFKGFHLLFAIGVTALAIRTLLDSEFRNSALLYLLVPFALSILLHKTTVRTDGTTTAKRYLNHLRDGTIVMLATSALLFEGFLCVLMFMPIYYAAITIGFLFSLAADAANKRGGGKHVYAIPALVVLLAMEGTANPLTFERYREATHVEVVNVGIDQLKANMARPIAFPSERHWFLSLFPLPTQVESGTLGIGDVHRMHFVYKRWFFTNFSEGDMALRIAEVGPTHIRTEIVDNTSYLSHYMKIEGTDVRFRDLGNGRTRVALTVKYRRLLDPYWYFGPMQQFAATQSAKYLIDSIIRRDNG